MSEPNVQAAREWIDAYNRRDMEALTEVTDPHFEFHSVFVAIESLFRGYDGLRSYFTELDDAYEKFQVHPSDFIDAGAAVLVIADARWCGRGSGAEGVTPINVVVWLRAGKVLRVETFMDKAPALEAVGLS